MLFQNVATVTALLTALVSFQPSPQQQQSQQNWVLESLKQGQTKIVAREGGSLEAFPGSRTAYEQARQAGVWGVTIPVQATQDELVVFSDETIERVLEAPQPEQQQWSVSQFSYESLPAFKEEIQTPYGEPLNQPNPQKEKPIRFEEALEIFQNSKTVLIIEDRFQGEPQERWIQQMRMIKMVKQAGVYARTIFKTEYTSQQLEEVFNQQTLTIPQDQEIEQAFQRFMDGSWYQNRQQNPIQGDVFATPWAFETLQQAPQEFQQSPIFPQSLTQNEEVSMSQFLQWEQEQETEVQLMINSLKQAGQPVLLWTANQEQDWKKAVELGASAYVTDRPAEARVFMMAQQWAAERIQHAQWQQWR